MMKSEIYGSKRPLFEIIRVAKEDLDDLKYKNGFNVKRHFIENNFSLSKHLNCWIYYFFITNFQKEFTDAKISVGTC